MSYNTDTYKPYMRRALQQLSSVLIGVIISAISDLSMIWDILIKNESPKKGEKHMIFFILNGKSEIFILSYAYPI